jgi:hypothetical protein
MEITACQGYHAVADGFTVTRMTDGKSVYKIYYVSIIRREKPQLYEWDRFAVTREAFEKNFSKAGFEGIGFAVVFPHITKVFRYSPHVETVLDIAEHDTVTLKKLDCDRGDGFHEFACYAEVIIAADEYHAWAAAGSVESYLEYQSPSADFPMVDPAKFGTYWTR